ncbi:MAG TPA: glycine zipper domain-containing protein [Opitutaceae bacterium]|nr:glycine zipper domain-containing protein [Opitutaceae bacterium]
MNPNKTLTVSLLSAALLAGCAAPAGPNTQTGAGVGAAAGALAGGIIGHNTGSGHTVGGAVIGAAAGGLAGAAIGNRRDNERTSDPTYSTADTQTGYVVQQPPPSPTSNPHETMPPQPSPDAVWISGYWSYTGTGGNPYEWVPGRWEYPPQGLRTWSPPSWQRQGDGYVYVRGHWQ